MEYKLSIMNCFQWEVQNVTINILKITDKKTTVFKSLQMNMNCYNHTVFVLKIYSLTEEEQK